MRTLAIAAALAVAACSTASGPDLGQAKDECRYFTRPFVEAWPCVRNTFSMRRDDNPDIQATFLARGDTIWADAKAGILTEEQARAAVDTATAEAMTAERQAGIASSQRTAAVLSQMRPYQPPPVTPIYQQSAPVSCVRTGQFVNCY